VIELQSRLAATIFPAAAGSTSDGLNVRWVEHLNSN
jgi:hypothetical protein